MGLHTLFIVEVNQSKATTHFQTMAFSLALYLAFPFIQITCTPLVLRGVGIRTWGVDNRTIKTLNLFSCVSGHMWSWLRCKLLLMSWMIVFISFWILTSIFCASSEGLKLDLMTTFTSSLVRPTSLTRGITRNGRMMSLVVRYLHYSAEQKQFTWKKCYCVLLLM